MTLLTTLRNYLFCFRSQVLMLTQMAPYCSPILVLIRPTFYTFLHSLVQITLYTSVDLWRFRVLITLFNHAILVKCNCSVKTCELATLTSYFLNITCQH